MARSTDGTTRAYRKADGTISIHRSTRDRSIGHGMGKYTLSTIRSGTTSTIITATARANH